jgi:hypothetical protein
MGNKPHGAVLGVRRDFRYEEGNPPCLGTFRPDGNTQDGTRHADRTRKAADRYQLHPRQRAGASGRQRGQMAIIRDGVSQAGNQARRGRPLGRPAHARRRPAGTGDRKEAARLRHDYPLVSRHSLSSAYVVDKEIAIIRQAKGDAVHARADANAKIALDLVRDKNLRPRDGKPLSDYSINERYRHMIEAADEIAGVAQHIEAERNRIQHAPYSLSLPEDDKLRRAAFESADEVWITV